MACKLRMRTWASILLGTLAVLHGLNTMILLVEAQGGGVIPLSDVIDHPVDKENNPSSSHNNPSSASHHPEETTYQGKPLSDKKKNIHIKIAQSHIQNEESTVSEVSDGENDKSNKMFRKDKSPDLQNPMKHASDQWLLKFLIEQYTLSDSVEEKVEILQNLENFSHKFENGRDLFKTTRAVQEILMPALNSTQTEIRKSAITVFAVAAQNNGVVQQIAKDAGAIRSLIHLMAFDPPVRAKALFALSSLLRNYPEAQGKFIHDGGIPALIKVAFSFETRKRSLSLVTDLLTERKYCLIDLERRVGPPGQEDEEIEMRSSGDHVDHYDNLEDPCDEFKVLEKALKDSGWCDVLADSVQAVGGFDTSDQLLTTEAVASSISFCKNEVAPYTRIFKGLLVKFQNDEDFQEESLTLQSIIDAVTNHDEL